MFRRELFRDGENRKPMQGALHPIGVVLLSCRRWALEDFTGLAQRFFGGGR
jgi:hypothetical protein